MTNIDATKILANNTRIQPPDKAGKALAVELLMNSDVDWDDLTIDLRFINAGILISAFFSTFLKVINHWKPELLNAARKIKWEPRFDFQKENISRWMISFKQ